MINFLVDESLPRSLARELGVAGYDAVHALDEGLQGKPDSQVFAHAVAQVRIIVSADVDFANVLEYPPGTHPGIVVARFPSRLPVPRLIDEVMNALATIPAADFAGATIIVEPAGVRRRGP